MIDSRLSDLKPNKKSGLKKGLRKAIERYIKKSQRLVRMLSLRRRILTDGTRKMREKIFITSELPEGH